MGKAGLQKTPARTHITLEWNCQLPGESNWVTGIVSSTNPSGPWREVTNLPYAGTNRVTLPIGQKAEFYRAFNRLNL